MQSIVFVGLAFRLDIMKIALIETFCSLEYLKAVCKPIVL